MEDGRELKYHSVTDKILYAFYKKVYPRLGYGFLEQVYQNAMVIELGRMGLCVVKEAPIAVYYEDVVVGEYRADLLVEDKVIVEIKAVSHLLEEHEAQLLNYLRATPYEVGLLLNFGPNPDIRRKVFDNVRKGSTTWRLREDGVEYEYEIEELDGDTDEHR